MSERGDTFRLQRIETFLTRFAAGAGTLYLWHLRGESIRARFGDDQHMGCPLSAGMTLDTGQFSHEGQFLRAALWHGLSPEEARVIAHASDASARDAVVQTIRRRLLAICRLEEPTHATL